MNGSHGEACLPKEIFSHENENINPSDSYNYSLENSDAVQSTLVVEAGEPFQDERSETPPMPSLVPSQDPPSQNVDTNSHSDAVDVESCKNMEETPGSSAG